MKKVILNLSLIIFFPIITFAQNVLTVDEAVSIALKNNFDILVALNNADIDKVNNTPGNAGMLPNIAITGSDSYSPGSNIEQKLPGGTSSSTSNSQSNSINATAGLSWT